MKIVKKRRATDVNRETTNPPNGMNVKWSVENDAVGNPFRLSFASCNAVPPERIPLWQRIRLLLLFGCLIFMLFNLLFGSLTRSLARPRDVITNAMTWTFADRVSLNRANKNRERNEFRDKMKRKRIETIATTTEEMAQHTEYQHGSDKFFVFHSHTHAHDNIVKKSTDRHRMWQKHFEYG